MRVSGVPRFVAVGSEVLSAASRLFRCANLLAEPPTNVKIRSHRVTSSGLVRIVVLINEIY